LKTEPGAANPHSLRRRRISRR